MTRLRMNHRLTAAQLILTGALAAAAPSAVQAFAEDLCLLDNGELDDCLPIPPGCDPELGEDYNSPACQSQLVTGALGAGRIRSTLHVDATYYLAQVVGIPRSSATMLAGYNEATDLGVYVPADSRGVPLVDPTDADGNFRPDACEVTPAAAGCEWVTVPLDGVTRGNRSTGGIFMHFHAPHTGLEDEPIPGLNGLNPDPTAAHSEVMLANLGRWAFGETDAFCTAGITLRSEAGDYATGSECYSDLLGNSVPIGGGAHGARKSFGTDQHFQREPGDF